MIIERIEIDVTECSGNLTMQGKWVIQRNPCVENLVQWKHRAVVEFSKLIEKMETGE